jgi:hypothetical protein
VDRALVSSAPLPEALERRYAGEGATPVRVDRAAFEAAGVEVVATDLLAEGDLIRHDPMKLAAAVLGLVPRAEAAHAG